MAPLDIPSPTPSHMPPPTLKRPRPSNTIPNHVSTIVPTAGQPRPKRRKPEGSVGPETGNGGERDRLGRLMPFGVGMVKGREEEWGEPADIKTKINFLDLPVETLYRYLEFHDLLPRWDVSPWSEEPCTPPNALYNSYPIPPAVPVNPSPYPHAASPAPTSPSTAQAMDVDSTKPATAEGSVPPDSAGLAASMQSAEEGNPTEENVPAEESTNDDDIAAATAAAQEEDLHAPPTTRSRTAPHRKPPTPSPPPPPPPREIKRGVMTLSDVHAARAVLAEKANSHWVKGLGGGQNQESSTIVAFLYKNKVGHGRLLRVYNPNPATYP